MNITKPLALIGAALLSMASHAIADSVLWPNGSTSLTVQEGEVPNFIATVTGKTSACTTTGLMDYGTPLAVVSTNPNYDVSSWLDFTNISLKLTQCGTGVHVHNMGGFTTPPGTTTSRTFYYFWGRNAWFNEPRPPALSRATLGTLTLTVNKLPDIPGCKIEPGLFGANDSGVVVNGVSYKFSGSTKTYRVGNKEYGIGRSRPAFAWGKQEGSTYVSYANEVCEVNSNSAPVASNRTLTVAEDTAGTVTLLATDVDGDALTYSLVTAPNSAHGTVTLSGNVATFTPRPNWNGTTTFTYRANDGTVNSNTATVTVTVTPVNDTPSVSNATLALDEDTVGTLTLGVTDVDLQFEGDSHTWSIVTAPNAAHGTASIAGNKLTFTPRPNWNGTTTLTYRATDSKGANSNTATITITVRPVNDAPVASNRTLTVAEDTAGTVTLLATDVDGDSLTYSLVTAPNSAHGTVTLSGNVATFTPRPNWNGTTSFTYRANDGTVNSNTATVTVTVTPVNDTPSVSNATVALDEDTVGTLTLGVTDVDLAFEGDSHTWSIVTAPNAAHGTASIAGNTLTFTPAKDWNGTTTLTYRATDSKGANSNTATITITVRPVNDAPVASNRTLTVAEDTAGTVTLLATDVDGDALTYSLVTAPSSAHGTVTISGDKATFTPKPNWNGTTTFTYRANDGTVNSNTATVTVTVTPVNDAPVGMTPLTIRTIEGRTVEVKVTVVPN